MIKRIIVITPFLVLAGLITLIAVVNFSDAEPKYAQEEFETSGQKLERKNQRIEYGDFEAFVYGTYEKWNNLSMEDQYAEEMGDETYQVLMNTLSETNRWSQSIEMDGVVSEFSKLNETARNLTNPTKSYTDEEKKSMISWFGKQLDEIYIQIKNTP